MPIVQEDTAAPAAASPVDARLAEARRASNATLQKLCIWAGPTMVIGWVASFWVLAGFIPPPDPGMPPEAVVRMYQDDATLIRLGLVITLFASALLVPYTAVIAAHMRRIEGRRSVLAWTQLASGALLSLEFIIPLMVWQAAAYRPELADGRLIQALNDMGWLMFVGVISTAGVQFLAIGLAILRDREGRVFPRWAGYFNVWVAILIEPAGVVPFFKSGPFAWDGVFAFFLPLAVFATWIAVMTYLLFRAVDSDVAETGEELRRAEEREALLARLEAAAEPTRPTAGSLT